MTASVSYCHPFAFFLSLCLISPAAMAIDINSLWNYSKPEVSEQRFRD